MCRCQPKPAIPAVRYDTVSIEDRHVWVPDGAGGPSSRRNVKAGRLLAGFWMTTKILPLLGLLICAGEAAGHSSVFTSF